MTATARLAGGRLAAAWQAFRGEGVAGILGRGAAGTLLVSGFGALAGVGVQMLLARLLGATGWGYYAYSWTLLNVLVLGARLGLDTTLIRYAAAYRVGGDWALLASLLRFADRSVWIASAVVAALSALVIAGLSPWLAPPLQQTLWVSCLALPAFGLLGLRGGALQGLRRVILCRVPEFVLRPPLTVLLAGLAWLALGGLTAPAAMLATVLALALAVLVGSAMLRRCLPPQSRALRAEDLPPAPPHREWMRVSLPLLFVSGMRLLLGQADILLVGILLGTTEAGIYTVASRLSHLITFGQNAANGIAAPMISELHSQGETQGLQRMVTLASWGSTLFALAASLVLVFGGQVLLSLYGKDFQVALPVLVILAAGQLINAATGPVGYLLNMTGHQDTNARILAWVVGLNLVLNVPAILLYGIVGSAITTGVLIAIKNLWTWWEVRRRLGINSSIFVARGLA